MDGREERNFLETNLSAAWQPWLEKFAVIGGGRGYIDAFSVARCFRWRARNERGLVGRLLLLEWQRFIPALAPLPSYFQVGRVQRIDADATRPTLSLSRFPSLSRAESSCQRGDPLLSFRGWIDAIADPLFSSALLI